MQELIKPDQTGIILEWGCSDNAKKILHLIDKASRDRKTAILISMDAEKAFDRVHWSFLSAYWTILGSDTDSNNEYGVDMLPPKPKY